MELIISDQWLFTLVSIHKNTDSWSMVVKRGLNGHSLATEECMCRHNLHFSQEGSYLPVITKWMIHLLNISYHFSQLQQQSIPYGTKLFALAIVLLLWIQECTYRKFLHHHLLRQLTINICGKGVLHIWFNLGWPPLFAVHGTKHRPIDELSWFFPSELDGKKYQNS